MYKCTECGLEFENKPEYCDCGNDEFVLTVPQEEKIPEPAVNAEITKASEPTPEPISAEEFSKAAAAEQNSYNNYKTAREPMKLPVSPFALFIFIMCILLSLMIWILWNPVKETAETVSEIIENVENKPIPSIDKLWKSPEPAKQEEQAPAPAPAPKQEKKTTVINIPKAANPVKKSVPKTTQTAKQQPKTTQTKKQQAVNNTQKAQNSAAEQAAKQAQEAAKKAQEAKAKAEAEAIAAAEAAKKAAISKQELYSYKINLRNTIGQKIDFTRVIGDGDCVISFKVDANGRLTNRAFEKQSANITLNNAVYNAVMAVPSYSAPPSGYKNETLRLKVSFNNGNFAITLE